MENTNKKFYSSFFIMLLTIAMQNVLVYGVNLADNIMLGKFSEVSMSGAGLVNQIQFLLQMLITGTGEGIIVIAARHWGEGDIPSIKRVSSVGMRFALVFSGVMFVLALFFPEGVLGILTNDEALITESAKYLRIIAFTYPIFAVTNILISTMRSVETSKIGFYISISTIITNVSLNYVLIFGKLGFAPMGIRGAAVATLASRVIELMIVVIYVRFIDKKLHLKLADYLKKSGDMLKRFVKTSVPVIMSSASWGIAMGLQTAILGRLDGAIGANSISSTVFSIVTVFIYGSSTAAGVALGKMIGENKKAMEGGSLTFEESKREIKKRAKTLQCIFLTLGILTSLSLFILKDVIIGFYDITESTKTLADSFMTVLCITVIGTSYQMPSLTGIIRAGGETSFVFYNDLIFMWGIVLPSSFIAAFVFELSPVIVFCCLKADQILKCAVAVFKVNRFNWIRDI
ncbi:MAG: MATE family efflux transporter [Clostridia bacterium]|nr:MATE family efflux transporter [Clostridia bacterium]